MKTRVIHMSGVVLALMMWDRAVTFAQTAAIAGTVTDTSGAVLPGVTVEASSPALIEKTRTAITDGRGLYQIVDVRAGVYTVTFTLPGFATIRREGVELAGGFTATIHAQLRVGAIEETVTVSGQTPLVDVRNVTQHNVITRELIEDLPTAKTLQNLAVLIPGVSISQAFGTAGNTGQDVGGNIGERQVRVVVHGSYQEDMPLFFDGMSYASMNNESARTQFQVNSGAVQEITMEAGVLSAEQPTSGIWTNIIPKQGGNGFSGYFLGNYTNDKLQAVNISPEQLAAGFASQTATSKIFDVNPAFGGPIRRDKLWFFTSFRYWGSDENPPGAFHDTDPLDYVFTADRTRPTVVENWYRSTVLRLTWQASQKQKVSFHGDVQDRCTCANGASSTTAFEASTQFRPTPQLFQTTWNWTMSNRMLLEAGLNLYPSWGGPQLHYILQPEVASDVYAVTDLSTGVTFRAPTSYFDYNIDQYSTKTSMTYVTGGHNLKVGLQTMWGSRRPTTYANNDATLRLLDGVPNSVTVRNTPFSIEQRLKMSLGLYAQDQWTLNRVTVNLGGRLEYINAYVPARDHPAVRYVGARSFSAVYDAPNWTDFSPRLGASWDLFGDAKTALKVSLGRYTEGITTLIASQLDPSNASVTAATRQWIDANRDFMPQDTELGPPSPSTFGQSIIRTRFDPELLTGFGKRMYNWEGSVGIQREVGPGLSISAAYFRRWYGNFRVADNLEVTPASYDPYCITAPTDTRLPASVSGQQICGLYDITPTLFGRQNNLVRLGGNFGTMSRIYDGVDLTGTVRIRQGATLQGGVNVGRTQTRACFALDSPSDVPASFGTTQTFVSATRFCEIDQPFQPQIKVLGTYPLPWWELMVSGTFQSLPGPEIEANWAVRSAVIAPSLGRPLAAGATQTVVVPLIRPWSVFGDRLNQFDFRLGKRFTAGPLRLTGQFDLYNLLNANPVLAQNNTYGPAWLTPVNILPGRLFKAGIEVTF